MLKDTRLYPFVKGLCGEIGTTYYPIFKLLLFHAVVDSIASLVDYRYLLCEVALLQCLHWWNF